MRRLLLAILPALACSCAFAPRTVVLRNYEPVVKAGAVRELSGKSVAIVDVRDQRVAGEADTTATLDPTGYEYLAPSDAVATAWSKDKDAAEGDTSPKAVIGTVRNGFGMKTADVVAIGEPVAWMRETLEREIVSQGGKLVPANEAEYRVSLELRHLATDVYFSTSCVLAVDVTVAAREPAAGKTVRICSKGSSSAWTASSWEYYTAVREAQQKVMWHVLRAIVGIDPPSKPPPSKSDDQSGA